MSSEQKDRVVVVVKVEPDMVNGYAGEVLSKAVQRPKPVEAVKAPSNNKLPQAKKTPAYLG